jgi:PAS domain S-box-containing protein
VLERLSRPRTALSAALSRLTLGAESQHLRTAFAEAAVGMAVVDATSMSLVSGNAALGELLGRPGNSFTGSRWPDFHIADDLEPGSEELTRDSSGTLIALRTRKRHRRPDGTELVAEVSAALLRTRPGEHSHYLVQVLDISSEQPGSRAAKRQELDDANERLEQLTHDLAVARDLAGEASRMKSAFVANMSHEIRTPINGVLGMTQLLSTADLPATQHEQAMLAHRSAEALVTVLEDVLDFARIEAGELNLEVVDVELRTIVDDTVRLFSGPATGKGLQLSASVDPQVPVWVTTDPTRLRQVLLNLVGNAVKFTEQGSVWIEVTREASFAGSEAIRIAVLDTGIGISPDQQLLLLEPFRQAEESATRRYGGAGLGLAISSAVIALLGGSLVLDSRPGAGSSFSFTLVLSSPAQPPHLPAPRGRVANPRQDRPLLLVAEDNLVNQKVAQGQLASLGYRVDVVPDGVAAVEAARTGDYAAVLMDCQMPRMDGYQATQEIRRAEKPGHRVPIIAVTASALPADRERCLGVGMDDHLAKPVQLSLLAATLERWIAPEPTSTATPARPAVDGESGDTAEQLDDEILSDLATLPTETLASLLDSYFLVTAERLTALRNTAVGGDDVGWTREITGLAHAMKGSSASLAARRMAEVAAELEQLGRGSLETNELLDPQRVDALLGRLEHEFSQVQPVLQRALLGSV